MWSAQDLQSAPNQSSHATVCAMSTKATSPAAIQCFSGAKVLLWIGHAPSCFKTAMCAAVPYPLCCAKLYCGHRSWYWSISLSRVTYTCTHTFGHCSYTPNPEPSSASACISALLDYLAWLIQCVMWHRDYYAPCLYSHTQVDASMHILLSVANICLLFIALHRCYMPLAKQ